MSSLGILNIGASDDDTDADTIRAGGRKLNLAAAVASRTDTAPPGSPALGDLYIVGASATGDWSGQDDDVAYYNGTEWEFYTPAEGWRAWVVDEAAMVVFTSGAWDDTAIGGGGGGGGFPFSLGSVINSAYDVTNTDLAGGVYREATGTITITIPSGLTGDQPLTIENVGAGVITFAAGGGVTLNARGGTLTLSDQFAAATLIPKGSDEYTLVGGLS